VAARHNVPVTQPATPSGAAQERDRFRDWPTPARYLVYGVLVVVLLLVLALIAATIVIRRPLPQTDGTLTLKGLDRQVQVLRDDTAYPRSTPTPATTCSTPRGSCRPRTGSGRWTTGGT
jgi:penicillin amidase